MTAGSDVIVLGAGLAGHCAAIAAAERGARVSLLEKMAAPGGSTLLSSGTFAFASTDRQRAACIEDSTERLAADLRKASGERADPALVRLYCQRQGETLAWLEDRGVEFGNIVLSSSMSLPRSHPARPAQLIDTLHRAARAELRIDYRANVRGLRLLREGSRIAGLRLADGTFSRAKTVVLATGGFTHATDLIARFSPRYASAVAVGGEGNVGDGLRMAWAEGADLVDLAWINGTFGISVSRYPQTTPQPEDEPVLRLAIYRGAIIVNLRAERFVDESASYKLIGDRCLDQPDGIGFQVFDAKIMAQSLPAPSSNDFRSALDAGLVQTATSIPELAAVIGLDTQAFARTVSEYNFDLESGPDRRYGRASLGSGYGHPVPIDTPPFYAYPCTTGVLGTYCGLRVDDRMRVIDVFGEPIEGLYAAGEVIGGFHGSGYMSGSALGKAAIFGRVAGEQAASHCALVQ
jgi:fumarate reductase flavoprotein subunit